MSISDNLKTVYDNIEVAKKRSGRTQDVMLVAVTKTVPAERIRQAYDAGTVIFGENRVQEMMDKQPVLPDNVKWHMIGRLQKNKIKYIIGKTELIHSVCDISQAVQIDRLSCKAGVVTDCLIQVNIGNEPSKAGVNSDELYEFVGSLSSLRSIRILGLMAIPPAVEDPQEARVYFKAMKELFDGLPESDNVKRQWLSMGMSHDYMVAVEEGANIVRVGSFIFGARS